MRFYLGTHRPDWLGKTAVPLFVSRRRLTGRKSYPRSRGRWALDSGGFSELNANNAWSITARQYASEVREWSEAIGGLDWAACMDWMCEPFVLAKTGLSIDEHQRRTIASYLELRDIAPDLPWVPVLQGWAASDYERHAEQYDRAGIALASLPTVGIGSVCRRQHTAEAERIIRRLSMAGIRLHGFGFKLQGLRAVSSLLASADSLAWSFEARRLGRATCGGAHRNCANCLTYALRWYERVRRLESVPATFQMSLFDAFPK